VDCERVQNSMALAANQGTTLGIFGIHRFFLGKWLTGLLWLVTGGLFLVGIVYDYWTLNGQIDAVNAEAWRTQRVDRRRRSVPTAAAPRAHARVDQQLPDPIRRLLVDSVRAVRRLAQVAASPIAHARRSPHAVSLIAFRGFGSATRICVTGRVIEDLGLEERADAGTREDRFFTRLRRARRLLLSREIPKATVTIRCGSDDWQTRTDTNGFFFACRPANLFTTEPMWHPYEIELADAPQAAVAPARGDILVTPSSARRLIISDIDDTVVYTGVANKLAMVWRLFATGANRRTPFPGIAAFYRALHLGADGGERNPIIYVSRSPWSLYPVLEEFFQLHRIPVGPVLLLRDWGVTYRHPVPRRAPAHKHDLIEEILSVDGDTPVVLVGDSGQRDPEIYADVVSRHPGRVAAIYIRDLEPGHERSRKLAGIAAEVAAAGSELIAVPDTLQMAADAVCRGWISTAQLEQIKKDAAAGER
jgi:phosphatidate phosphatase APP1